jgi:NTP pyrophosphatase (non-canonical NTP hydrolase)
MTTPENSVLPPPNFNHIADYEAWATQYWLNTPGSIEAQLHAREKHGEETHELIEALSSGAPDDIISEAGDVLWTATASGSNAGISLTEVLHGAFPGYLSPADPVATDQVDPLASTLFDGVSIDELAQYLTHNEHILGKTTKQWFVLRDTVSNPEKTFADAWTNIKRADATTALLNTVLLVSYIAQHHAHADLQTVMQRNYQKIEGRLQSGAPVTKLPRP